MKLPLIFALFLSVLVSCASVSSKKKLPNTSSASSSKAKSLPSVPSSLSIKNFSSYFRGVDGAILFRIQNGSPLSIREAVSALHKPNGKYSEQERVLFAMCASIVKYAWPNEKITWAVPQDLPDNLYTATLKSIGEGSASFTSAENDIFMLTLPCLALFTSSAQNGFYVQAEDSLKKALEINPSSVLNLYLAGTLAFRTHNYEKAVFFYERAAEIEPRNNYIMLARIRALLKAGEHEKAYESAAQALRIQPANMEVIKLNAKAAFASGRYNEAESLAARVLQREPDNTAFLLFRARVLFELEDYLNASTLLDLCARSDKTSKEYLLLRARLQSVWNKNPSAAAVSVQEALNRYKDDGDVLLFAAELSATSGQNIDSKTAFELATAVLEKDPENARAFAVIAKDAVKKKQWRQAYEALSSLEHVQTLSAENTLLYVQVCLMLNKTDQARTLFKDIYSGEHADENMQQWYIRLLIAEGKKNEAAQLINSLLVKSSGKMKSVLYYERSRLGTSDAQILADLRSSLTANPRNENALYDLYAYYYRLNDYRKAQYYLKQVIALNPNDAGLLKLNADLEAVLK